MALESRREREENRDKQAALTTKPTMFSINLVLFFKLGNMPLLLEKGGTCDLPVPVLKWRPLPWSTYSQGPVGKMWGNGCTSEKRDVCFWGRGKTASMKRLFSEFVGSCYCLCKNVGMRFMHLPGEGDQLNTKLGSDFTCWPCLKCLVRS